jgi:hypothetical protein
VSDSGLPNSGDLELHRRLQKIRDRWNERIPLSVHAPGSSTWPHDPTPDHMLDQAKTDVNWLIHQLQACLSSESAREALAALTPYVKHEASCAARPGDAQCNCGASIALEAMHAVLRTPLPTRDLAEQDWLADFWLYWRSDPAGEWFSDFLESAKVACESRAARRVAP